MKRLVLALACVLPLAACGGGSGSDSTTTTRAQAPATTTGAATAPSTTTGASPSAGTTTGAAPTAAGDRRIARAAVLRREDFAAGWKAKDDDGTTPTSPCGDIRRARSATSGRFVGPTFSRGGTMVDTTVYLYTDEARAAGAARRLMSAATRRCTSRVVARQLRRAVRGNVGDPTVATLSTPAAARVADGYAAFQVEVPYTEKGRRASFQIRLTVVRQARGLSLLLTQALPNERIMQQLERVAGARLRRALDAG